MPKNIVIFSDGTGQEGGVGNNTNVYKLFNMVLDRSREQVAFYDQGLGTGWRKVTGNIGGGGISKNILECYKFIFEQYEAGDGIFLFGFSRGVATVRSLSAFIHLFGILPKSRPELIPRAYKIYKTRNRRKRDERAEAFVARHHTMWCRIKFLGVWDTVAALGLPFQTLDVLIDKVPIFRHRFQDFRLSKSVENAYHALAIDDERRTFHPVLWEAECEDDQIVEQVWFCGMHTDVGGGYKETGLSDISLGWMIEKAKPHGLHIYPDHEVDLSPDPNGTMHDSRGEALSKFYRRKVRNWPSDTHGEPILHPSVRKRTMNRHNMDDPPYHPWIFESILAAPQAQDRSVSASA